MSFTSVAFLIIFFPICILVYYFMNEKYRNVFACIMSIVFYSWCGIKFLILMLVSSTLMYVVGRLIEKSDSTIKKRILLILAITYNIVILFFYKYLFNIFPSALDIWQGITSQEISFISLPLGISFYTFSLMSYVIDIYWEKCKANHSLVNVYLYVLFFPKVVQGPIMRYSDFESQLNSKTVNIDGLNIGLERFIKGMVKKLLIADKIQLLVNYSFNNITDANVDAIPAWIGIISYLLQLYYDFSGYSDMAIGLGNMMGFKLPENFDHPYMASSVAEYWRRWHISLGEWFRDYMYMPCSRWIISRKLIGKLKKNKMLVCDLFALAITWLFTGIWHGCGEKFVIYGLWWFAFIAFERIRDNFRKNYRKKKKLPLKKDSWWQVILNHLETAVAVVFGQVIFRSSSMSEVLLYWQKMLSFDFSDSVLIFKEVNNYTIFIFIVAIIFCFPVLNVIKDKFISKNTALTIIYRITLVIFAVIAFSSAVSSGYTAFLYEIY